MEEKNSVTVNIANRTYCVVCPPNKVADLHEAAEHLNSKLNETHVKNTVVSADNLMIYVLNLTHDFLQLKKQKSVYGEEVKVEINNLHNMIVEALAVDNATQS